MKHQQNTPRDRHIKAKKKLKDASAEEFITKSRPGQDILKQALKLHAHAKAKIEELDTRIERLRLDDVNASVRGNRKKITFFREQLRLARIEKVNTQEKEKSIKKNLIDRLRN